VTKKLGVNREVEVRALTPPPTIVMVQSASERQEVNMRWIWLLAASILIIILGYGMLESITNPGTASSAVLRLINEATFQPVNSAGDVSRQNSVVAGSLPNSSFGFVDTRLVIEPQEMETHQYNDPNGFALDGN